MALPFFSGRTEPTLDSKARLFLPQNIRDKLGESFVLSLTGDLKTLCFYPTETFDAWYKKLSVIDETDEEGTEYYRMVLSCTFDLSTDSQGRVLIPQSVRSQFGLTEGANVVLSGAGNRLELWSAESYADGFNKAISDRSKLVSHVNSTYFAKKTDDGVKG